MDLNEFPYEAVITRTILSDNGDTPNDITIYEGPIDYTMPTAEIGQIAQTSDYIIFMPLVIDVAGKFVIPKKNDKISVTGLGDNFILIVNNYEPSQLGRLTIYATRGGW